MYSGSSTKNAICGKINMSWYNLFSWFGRNKEETSKSYSRIKITREQLENEFLIRCDNPQCSQPIEGNNINYNAERREVYHPGKCALIANAYRAMTSSTLSIGNIDTISREEAYNLFQNGKLVQAKGLEKKVE